MHYPGDVDPICKNFQDVEDYVKEVILEIYSKDIQDYEENTGEIVIYPPDDYH